MARRTGTAHGGCAQRGRETVNSGVTHGRPWPGYESIALPRAVIQIPLNVRPLSAGNPLALSTQR